MRPGGRSFLQCSAAMLVEGAVLGTGLILSVALFLVGSQWSTPEKRHSLGQECVVAGCGHVVRRDKGQPQQVIGATGAHPAPRRRVPPVQHVPRFKLVARRS